MVHTLASMSPECKARVSGIVLDSVPGAMDIPQAVRCQPLATATSLLARATDAGARRRAHNPHASRRAAGAGVPVSLPRPARPGPHADARLPGARRRERRRRPPLLSHGGLRAHPGTKAHKKGSGKRETATVCMEREQTGQRDMATPEKGECRHIRARGRAAGRRRRLLRALGRPQPLGSRVRGHAPGARPPAVPPPPPPAPHPLPPSHATASRQRRPGAHGRAAVAAERRGGPAARDPAWARR